MYDVFCDMCSVCALRVSVVGPMWLYLQWGPLGPVDNILVENNYHNQTVAGGCATPQHQDTCQATGYVNYAMLYFLV